MTKKEETRKRSAVLKEVRKAHQATIKRAQRLLKAYREFEQICQIVDENPKTVPEVAQILDKPTHQVLWHMNAMRKYDLIVEDGMSGAYVLYKKAEAQSS
jgi:hypothetical protein